MAKFATFLGKHIYLDVTLFKPKLDEPCSIDYKIDSKIFDEESQREQFLETVTSQTSRLGAEIVRMILEEFGREVTRIILEPLQISLSFNLKAAHYEAVRQKTLDRIEAKLRQKTTA